MAATLSLLSGQLPFAQVSNFPKESLEEIAARSPTETVQLSVDFHSIQREPQIVAMLDGSQMELDEIKFKFVGSGGGSMGAFGAFGQSERLSVEEIFDEAELEHRLFFQLLVSEGKEIPEVVCPVDDVSASTTDQDGIPGEPAVELACGVRVVEMKVSGPAERALDFQARNRGFAEFKRSLSEEEIQHLMELMRNE
jgi:hypothetical protein